MRGSLRENFKLSSARRLAGPAVHNSKNDCRRAGNPAQCVAKDETRCEPALSRSQAIAVADQHSHLNRAQKSVVEDVLSSSDRVQGIQGYAGTGKTTTLSVIRAAAEAQGYVVEGLAPTSRAARQLGEAGVETGTLQGFLAGGTNREASGKEAFLFCGRVESGEHEPNSRFP